VTFDFEGEGTRLDKFLVERLPEFSRSRLQSLITDGFVLVDGAPAKKAGQMLDGGERVTIRVPPAQATALAREQIPLELVFEDDDLMVINKPAGIVVHPAAGHDSGTLVNAVLGYEPDLEGIGGEERPGVVHRLDKDTSGLIVLAKNERAHRWLTEQFKNRAVEKTYLALVDGSPPTPAGRVEAAIGRDLRDRKKLAVVSASSRGREAISEYRTLERLPLHTLLEIHPLTGRTHQIRVHCAFLGCPVAGDRVYGRRKSSIDVDRHFLHAWRLKVRLPGNKQVTAFEAPLPEELERVLKALRKGT
jgi:23S rRNA pseudouridine1911/1915/1917 synthase